MLVTLHIHAEPTSRSPLLYLLRQQDGGLFDRFAEHFQRIWNNADPIEPETRLAAPIDPAKYRPPTPQEAQHALERLRTQHTI